MTAASDRLGEEGIRNASRAASRTKRMKLPGVGREHQAGLDEMARHFAEACDGKELGAAWERQVERESKAPSGSACGPRGASAEDSRQSQIGTASGVGCDWKSKECFAITD